MSDALKLPSRRQRKPAKAAPPAMDGLAFPKPAPKRAPMKPGQVRRKPIKQRRETPRRGPWRSKEHRAAVRTLPCAVPGICRRRDIQASHVDVFSEKGAGMKAGDQRCIPHCRKHHEDWDQRKGVFAGWSKELRAKYAEEASHEVQMMLGLRGAA